MEIAVRNLSVTFPGGVTALRGVDLEVQEGESVTLLGQNGAGKSTLLRCLLRVEQVTSGVINLDGQDLGQLTRRELRVVRGRVGVVSQRFDLIGNIGVFHNVALGALSRGGIRNWHPALMSRYERMETMACLERVGLGHLARRRADTLSGGQQQRVAVARMLMQRPRLIIADEPVASLDPAASHEVMRLLREVGAGNGVTTILALHQLDLALQYSDRIVALRAGELVLDVATSEATRTMLDSIYATPPDARSNVGTH